MAQDDDKATTEAAVSDDAKAKFREALERKKSRPAPHRGRLDQHRRRCTARRPPGPSQRRFQRKSGSA